MEHDFEDWGAPLELRAIASQVPPLIGSYAPELPRAPRAFRRRWARRVARAAKAAAYVTAAAAVFSAGWLSRGVMDGGASSPSASSSSAQSQQTDPLVAALLPREGITLDVRWRDLPKRLAEAGVLDIEKFKAAAQQAGLPLTAEQLDVLARGSNDPIRVDASSAYFTLDVLWALGLANNNTILTAGPMAQRGRDEAGGYASTGGWTLGAKPGPEYLASLELLPLTPEQQKVVEEVAYNSYRPCCGNMTAFPDCNHGMAALALAELMAAQGATADEVFEALKAVSPFWFPTQYHHVAMYFQSRGQQWQDVDARVLMGQQLSSSNGYNRVAALLQQQGVLGGGPVGKASGCAP